MFLPSSWPFPGRRVSTAGRVVMLCSRPPTWGGWRPLIPSKPSADHRSKPAAAAPTPAGELSVHLTSREREIVRAILDGCSNREIAERLGIREQSVRNALSVVYEKFHVRTRLQLSREAGRRNWQ